MTIYIIQADYTRPEHQAAIRQLMNIYAIDPMGGGTPLPAKVLEDLPQALANIGTAITLLAFDADEPVGLITGFLSLSTFKAKPLLNIHDVIVIPDYRGCGISRQLLQQVEAYAVERDCCKLTLEVLSGNRRAQQVYRQFGFDDYALDPDAGTAQFWQKLI